MMDVAIFLSTSNPPNNYNTLSGWCELDQTTNAPIAGIVYINAPLFVQLDPAGRQQNLIHALTHILGLDLSLLQY